MSMMGPHELSAVENEVKLIQSNVRTWLLRKNYTNLRDAAKTLQVAWRERRSASSSRYKTSSISAIAPTKLDLSVSTSKMNNTTKSIDECAATLQAATRGMLARRSFERAKKQTMASLVIFQWWVQTKSLRNENNKVGSMI
jgi:hypothetical protein